MAIREDINEQGGSQEDVISWAGQVFNGWI